MNMKQNANDAVRAEKKSSLLLLAQTFFTDSYSILLCCVLLISVSLNFFQLGQSGYSNLYYAAAIKSMLTSWHNFFFVSFDPTGFVSVDKPPVGFWLQVISAKVFGFSPWSLMLPQALAGIGSVALLAHLVRRIFGPSAALFASLTLALFPISVITNRNNDIDSLLVFVTLCATWSITLAVESGRLRWLLLGAALVGLGFNIKTLEAYLVLPTFVLLYVCAAPLRWRTKIFQLLLALLVLVAISFAWIISVDLTPASQRPYVGSSGNNTEISLTFGYNGLVRVFGLTFLSPESTSQAQLSTASSNPIFDDEIGNPGPLRLINSQLGGQVSWLLPLAIAGLVAVSWRSRPQLKSNRQQQGILLWGSWFLIQAIYFSASAYFHIYYMIMIAPSICALAGIGLAAMWRDYREPNWRGWLLPISLLLTAILQVWMLSAYYASWSHWLSPIIFILTLLVVLILCIVRLTKRLSLRHIAGSVFTIGSLVLLLASATWSTLPIVQKTNTAFPIAGPLPQQTQQTQLLTQYYEASTHPDPLLINYLVRHQGQARYLVGTTSALTNASFILATGRAVMALGGYSGIDQILTRKQVIALINSGTIRYFLIFGYKNYSNLPFELLTYFAATTQQTAALDLPNQSYITSWIQIACVEVLTNQWRPGYLNTYGTINSNSMLTLFDCQGATA